MTEVWGVFVQKVASSTSSAWAMVGILGWGGGSGFDSLRSSFQ